MNLPIIGLQPRFAASVLLSSLLGFTMVVPRLAADTTVPPTVTSEPSIAIVPDAGSDATFMATADGSPAPSIQWQFAPDRNGPWADIPGATEPTLVVTASDTAGDMFALGNTYRAVFTNSAGTATSRPARLASRAHWMRDLEGDIAFLPMTELTIPGAHDMGTYGINGGSDDSTDNLGIGCGSIGHDVCQSYGSAQDSSKNAAAELNDGIRYFDLRVCGHAVGAHDFDVQSQHLMTCHSLEGAPLQDILDQTRAFVDSHPGEVVILDFNHHFELNPDIEAAKIEAAFSRADGSSLLIPPQYCAPSDLDSGTCAGTLTLHAIEQQQLGSVIVNFENDGAPGDLKVRCTTNAPECTYFIQPVLDSSFYDRHPRFWGRGPTPNATDQCTFGAALPSCFGNDSSARTVLSRVRASLGDNGHYAIDTNTHVDAKRFFVQFLQTTPGLGFILLNPAGSLLDMAMGSNPIVGPAVLACGAGDECFGEFRPENLNILAINFYNRTDYTVLHTLVGPEAQACDQGPGTCPLTSEERHTLQCIRDTETQQTASCTFTDPIHFDFVEEAVRFNAYARTAPIVSVNAPIGPAATGWYNAAVLGGQNVPLNIGVDASDFRFPTGISALDCVDDTTFTSLTQGTDAPSIHAQLPLHDGFHLLDCRSTDGAASGFHLAGHRGAGPGSTPAPTIFRVDTTPPQIQCPAAELTLHQPITSLTAIVSDAVSGPLSATVEAPISTSQVGSFAVSLTAFDMAGNTTTVSCPYTVSYSVALRYDASRPARSGSVVGIQVEIDDFFGVNVGGGDLALTATVVTMTGTGVTRVPTSPGQQTLTFHSSQGSGYLYDLKTTGYDPGAYTLGFAAGGDPRSYAAPFVIR